MRRTRGILAAAIVGVLALAIVTTAASASASTGTSAAAKAKKKCRKAHTKKSCKRRKKADAPRSPVIRATLTWGIGGANDVDADLFVFDPFGGRAGNGSNTIPLSSISPDVSGPAGSETFTDSLFTPQAARDLSFGVCYSAGGSVHTNLTLTYVTADGVVHGDSRNPGSSTHFEYPGGAPMPAGYC